MDLSTTPSQTLDRMQTELARLHQDTQLVSASLQHLQQRESELGKHPLWLNQGDELLTCTFWVGAAALVLGSAYWRWQLRSGRPRKLAPAHADFHAESAFYLADAEHLLPEHFQPLPSATEEHISKMFDPYAGVDIDLANLPDTDSFATHAPNASETHADTHADTEQLVGQDTEQYTATSHNAALSALATQAEPVESSVAATPLRAPNAQLSVGEFDPMTAAQDVLRFRATLAEKRAQRDKIVNKVSMPAPADREGLQASSIAPASPKQITDDEVGTDNDLANTSQAPLFHPTVDVDVDMDSASDPQSSSLLETVALMVPPHEQRTPQSLPQQEPLEKTAHPPSAPISAGHDPVEELPDEHNPDAVMLALAVEFKDLGLLTASRQFATELLESVDAEIIDSAQALLHQIDADEEAAHEPHSAASHLQRV